jgi:acetylornithine/succinyldiaminopimelate/putrescine aminotransferase
MLAAMTNNAAVTNEVILKCQDKGPILFCYFEECYMGLPPPLTISDDEIREGCAQC